MKVFLQTLLFVSIAYFCHVTFFKLPEKSMKTLWYECIYWLCIRVCMNAGAVVVEIICIVQSVPITTKVRIPHMTRCTRYNNVITFVSDLRQVGRWFSPGTLVSSTNKTDRHDIAEILLFSFNTLIPLYECIYWRFCIQLRFVVRMYFLDILVSIY